MALAEAERAAYQRKWHAEAYKQNPAKFVERSRAARRARSAEINRQRRVRDAKRRAAELERQSDEARAVLLRPPETLEEWFRCQSRFSEWVQVARELDVSPQTMRMWRDGKFPPVRARRRKLYELTGLACYADAAAWRPKEPSRGTLRWNAPVPLLADLVVRCGLATRELQRIRIADIGRKGIQLGPRLIRFGDGWHQFSRSSLDAWMSSAKPTDFLFFYRKPVDRSRPADGVWIVRHLAGGGIRMHARRTARVRHFAGDVARLGVGPKLYRHLREVHGLSRSGTGATVEQLRRRWDTLPKGARKALDPGAAYDLLFSKAESAASRGRRPLAPENTRAAYINRQVLAALPRFDRLCPLLADLLLKFHEKAARKKAEKGGFLEAEVNAAAAARTNRPLVAARHYVAAAMGRSYEYVKECSPRARNCGY